MKRSCLYLMILALVLSCMPFGAMGEEAASTRLVPEGETATLTVFRPMDANLQDYVSDWNDTPYCQELERLTGVHVEYISPTMSAATEALNMLLVSGEMPDIIMDSRLYAGGTYQGVLDGYFLDLAPYLETYAPDYYKIITSEDAIWREAVDDSGVVSAFYRIFKTANPSWMRLVLKKELMDQLGETEVPVTVDDWSNLFQKMLDAGVTPFMLNATGYDEKFMGAYNIRQDFYQEDGQVKYGQVQQGFYDYLTLMHDWYAKGYISKDFVSQSNVDTMFALGEIGTYDKPIVAAYNFGVAEGYTVLSTPYPRLTEDQFLHWDSYKATLVYKDFDYGVVSVASTCQQPELAVQWLNFLYTDAGMDLANWGIEGLNYEIVDGQRQYLPAMWDYNGISQEGLNYYFKAHNAATYADNDTVCHANLLKSPEATAIRLQYDDDPLLDSALYLPNISMTEEESETKTSIMNDIDTYVDEMVLKFIVGTESLDQWDAYVSTVESMGLEQALSAVQSAYNRYMSVTIQESN